MVLSRNVMEAVQRRMRSGNRTTLGDCATTMEPGVVKMFEDAHESRDRLEETREEAEMGTHRILFAIVGQTWAKHPIKGLTPFLELDPLAAMAASEEWEEDLGTTVLSKRPPVTPRKQPPFAGLLPCPFVTKH